MARTDKNRTPALAYLRTSSAANVGGDKDSDKRQREAIEAFARRAGFELAGEFYDAAVSGKDPIEGRPGFKALLERVVGNGVRIVIVEDASRFARHLLTQEAGISLLVGLGVRVMTAAGDDLTDSDDEFRVAMRQIMGVFSQLEKTRLVKKLKAARDRKRKPGVRVEGRKTRVERLVKQKTPEATAEITRLKEAVELARRLRRANPITTSG
jgi:DNA invertase Pin-like site-specific DNA recombinase